MMRRSWVSKVAPKTRADATITRSPGVAVKAVRQGGDLSGDSRRDAEALDKGWGGDLLEPASKIPLNRDPFQTLERSDLPKRDV